jgi:hypothetical protein
MNATEMVLNKLKKNKKGLTVNDFPQGFRLSHYIYELRGRGYNIETLDMADYSNGYFRIIGRYILRGEYIGVVKPRQKRKDNRSKARALAYKLIVELKGEQRKMASDIYNLLGE